MMRLDDGGDGIMHYALCIMLSIDLRLLLDL